MKFLMVQLTSQMADQQVSLVMKSIAINVHTGLCVCVYWMCVVYWICVCVLYVSVCHGRDRDESFSVCVSVVLLPGLSYQCLESPPPR